MILIVAPRSDDHAVPVAAELERRGVRVAWLDTSRPGAISARFDPDLRATVAGVDMADVETVWLRRIPTPVTTVTDRAFAVAETWHALSGIAQSFAHLRWVNPLHALALDGGWGKVRQLQVARRVGLEIPRTLMSNDPEAVRAFVASCAGGAIYKPFASTTHDGRPLMTTDVTVHEDFQAVAACPGIFQERVPRAADLRVTVMGSRVFACRVEAPPGQLDYRTNYLAHPRRAVRLPSAVESGLVALHRELGLVFGTCDLVERPDGGLVWLETNQSGQWTWTADVFEPGELVRAVADLIGGA